MGGAFSNHQAQTPWPCHPNTAARTPRTRRSTSLDDSTGRIVPYLSDRAVPINVLFFQVFTFGAEQLLSRAMAKRRVKLAVPWSFGPSGLAAAITWMRTGSSSHKRPKLTFSETRTPCAHPQHRSGERFCGTLESQPTQCNRATERSLISPRLLHSSTQFQLAAV